MGSSYLRMGWLTSGLSLGLIVAICSVHRHDTTEDTGGQGQNKVEDTLNIDLNDMMNMAKKYLGEDGVAKLINGDYSEIEKMGKKLLGGNFEGGKELLNNLLKAIPEGTLGKKLDDSETGNTQEESDQN